MLAASIAASQKGESYAASVRRRCPQDHFIRAKHPDPIFNGVQELHVSTKLHLGCGNIYQRGWINIDLDSPRADMRLDLTDPLPFNDDSVQYIYSEHFIEHISRPKAVFFLSECKRVLSDDGVLRLSTPDLQFLVECYLNKNIGEWGDLWAPNSPCNLMNEGMRSWGHTYLYDFDELLLVLAEAGFGMTRRMEWSQSAHSDLTNLETRPYHRDLIIEVDKNPKTKAPDSSSPLTQERWRKWIFWR